MSITIGLLRHGQTDWNLQTRLQGISDIELNEEGKRQAISAGRNLNISDWNSIASSPLKRARQTAALVNESLNFSAVEVIPRLLERNFGIAEGLTYVEWREKYGSAIQAPGSETVEDLTVRSLALLAEFETLPSGSKLLAVSHGALIRRVVSVVSDGAYPGEGDRFENLSLSILRFTNGNWAIQNFDPKTIAS